MTGSNISYLSLPTHTNYLKSTGTQATFQPLVLKYDFVVFFDVAVGTFDLTVPVDALFFIGSQLVATSHTGKIGVWNSMTQHWQVQCVYSGSLAVSAAKLLFLSTVCFCFCIKGRHACLQSLQLF